MPKALSDAEVQDFRRRLLAVAERSFAEHGIDGVTVRQLNARLVRYGRKFGPDPASEAACIVGGVLANNASGMACRTVENSYRTLESVIAVCRPAR